MRPTIANNRSRRCPGEDMSEDGRSGRDQADFRPDRRFGAARFEQAVRCEITRRGGQQLCLRIVRALFTALSDPAGVIAHRPSALERVQLLAEDWQLTQTRLIQAEQRMTGVRDELGLTALVTSITGLSPVGAAAILAETGDPRRFATGRALVKHAGLAPREKLSGAFTGRTCGARLLDLAWPEQCSGVGIIAE
jgi:transposase